MEIKEYEKLVSIADEHLKMQDNEKEIVAKNNLIPNYMQFWTKCYAKQNKTVQELKIQLNEVGARIYTRERFEGNYQLTGKEAEMQTYGDPEYCEVSRKLKDQEAILDFIDKTINNIRTMSFNIKNYLDYRKLMMGC